MTATELVQGKYIFIRSHDQYERVFIITAYDTLDNTIRFNKNLIELNKQYVSEFEVSNDGKEWKLI